MTHAERFAALLRFAGPRIRRDPRRCANTKKASEVHRTLERQLRDALGSPAEISDSLADLLALVDESYRRADEERSRLEGSLAQTSEELLRANAGRRQRAEEALRQSEQKYRSLFEESRDVIFTTGADSKLQDVNPAGVELFGFATREEMLNADLAQLIYRRPGDRDGFLQRVITNGVVKNQPLDLQRLDGERIYALASATAVHDGEGNVLRVRGILRDVTERRAIEHQLHQSQKMEAVGRLAGGVAHDFNNLLTAVIGYADLLANQLEARGEEPRHLEQIQNAADRGADLVRQLLAFSRQQVLSPQVIDLNQIVSGIEKLLGRVIGEDIKLQTELDPRLGPVLADPNQIEQVVLNLVVNGREAMPDGGTLTLRTRSETMKEGPGAGLPPGSYAVLEIDDTGIGIEESSIDRIFDPFFTTKPAGTGLGLATVYGIVNQSEGRIVVDSKSGQGTRFTVFLPTVDDQPAEKPKAEVHQGLPRGHETILIVEDEDSVRELLQHFLVSQGYSIYIAHDGDEGLKCFKRHAAEIALLLTDVVMPKMSGQDLSRKLRQLRPELKVLFMSGYSETENPHLEKFEPSAATGFLRKPFTIETLALKLREILGPGPAPSVVAKLLGQEHRLH